MQTLNRPQKRTVLIRGQEYTITEPSDFRIRAIQEYARTPVSDRRREGELAHALRSMLPELPDSLVVSREVELVSGQPEMIVRMHLKTYELMQIVQQATIGYIEEMLADLKATPTATKEEADSIKAQIETLERDLHAAIKEAETPPILDIAKVMGKVARPQKKSISPLQEARELTKTENVQESPFETSQESSQDEGLVSLIRKLNTQKERDRTAVGMEKMVIASEIAELEQKIASIVNSGE